MTPTSAHQQAVRSLFDRLAPERAAWVRRNGYFYAHEHRYLRTLVPAGSAVLEIGCGNGQLLAALEPSRGVGIDLSPAMIGEARAAHPHLEFHAGDAADRETYRDIDGPFDAIVLSDTIGYLADCQAVLAALKPLMGPRTRLVVAYYAPLWAPWLRTGEALGLKMPQGTEQSWLATADIVNLMGLAGYEVVGREWRFLMPRHAFGLGPLINRFVAPLPGVRRLCLRNYVVARAVPEAAGSPPSATVLVPCRNERGNIEDAVVRLPRFAPDIEIMFVEGHSTDGTFAECVRVRDAHPGRDIKAIRQDGIGKGDAVRKGFEQARGDILVILDGDLTVAPEDLGKFYDALAAGRCEFANGSRLVYPLRGRPMPALNRIANRVFSVVFSYLLNQRLTDTLCGTKALWRSDYRRIAAGRHHFGDFDPFGDFDLIFGAARLNLRIMDVPVRYAERTYGASQISRFRHGALLARMALFAFRKLKAL